MINIRKEGILLQKTAQEFENKAVLNPAAIRDGDCALILPRIKR